MNDTVNAEESRKALINAFAIGKILGRTVILPRLPCVVRGKIGSCPWNSMFYISDIDKYFNGKYRESVFLMHPKVPNDVKDSLSDTFLIKSSFYNKPIDYKDVNKPSIKYPKDKQNGATEKEIIRWFSDSKESVLRFHSLYNAFKGFSETAEKAAFDEMTKKAFRKAEYRQYDW